MSNTYEVEIEILVSYQDIPLEIRDEKSCLMASIRFIQLLEHSCIELSPDK